MPIVLAVASLGIAAITATRGLISETKSAEKAMTSTSTNIMGLILVGTAAFIIYKSVK